ncbi:MAG TPA: hypothetical protein ENI11_00985 [Actinobacteria bacterium]|nr:hypothetical protein [Actinomycetota bacterium]
MKKGISFRVIILLVWVFAMLLPIYSFIRGSVSFKLAFDRVFQTQASHVVTHLFLYSVLAYLLASVLFRSGSSAKRLSLFVLMAVVAVAVAQEGIQMVSEDVAFGLDEIFDVLVDLGGGIIGIALFIKVHTIAERIKK